MVHYLEIFFQTKVNESFAGAAADSLILVFKVNSLNKRRKKHTLKNKSTMYFCGTY